MHNYEDLIGQLIAGRYRVTSYLKKGGMGVTYRVWDTQKGAPAVVKMPLPVEAARNQSFVERFHREIRVMAMFSHPNIVPITDTGDHDGAPFFVMPYLPGGSVWDRRPVDASGTPLPGDISRLYDWLPLIASALDYVHGNGAVHRDVKPANIFFDAHSRPFLGDFGIAKLFDESGEDPTEESLTRTGTAVGTDGYMAPEFFIRQPGQRRATYDGRVDQYALAVMVYEAACGERPFTGDTSHIIAEILTQPPPDLRARRTGLATSFYRAVHRALEKDPAARFANCTIFAGAVLQDVVKSRAERGMVRLLCPACRKILKLESSLAGRKGLCPKCRTEMVVGKNLDALWLPREEAAQTTSAQEVIPSLVSPQRESKEELPSFEQFTAFGDRGDVPKHDTRAEPAKRDQPTSGKKFFGKRPAGKGLYTKGKKPQWPMLAALSALVVAGLIILWWKWPRPQPVLVLLGDLKDLDGDRISMSPLLNMVPERVTDYAAFFFEKARPDNLPAIRLRAHDVPDADDGPGSHPGFRIRSDSKRSIKAGANKAEVWELTPETRTGFVQNTNNNIYFRDVGTALVCKTQTYGVSRRNYTLEVFFSETHTKKYRDEVARRVLSSMQLYDPNRKPGTTGLLQEFFTARELDPKNKFKAECLSFDLTQDFGGPPLTGMPKDNFSFRLSGFLFPRYDGEYSFKGYRDDGMRMWVDGKKIVDEWRNNAGYFRSNAVKMTKDRPHKIEIQVFDGGGPCKLNVQWQSDKQELEEIPQSRLRPARAPKN